MIFTLKRKKPQTYFSRLTIHEVLKNLFAEYNYMASFLFKVFIEIKRAHKKACKCKNSSLILRISGLKKIKTETNYTLPYQTEKSGLFDQKGMRVKREATE